MLYWTVRRSPEVTSVSEPVLSITLLANYNIVLKANYNARV